MILMLVGQTETKFDFQTKLNKAKIYSKADRKQKDGKFTYEMKLSPYSLRAKNELVINLAVKKELDFTVNSIELILKKKGDGPEESAEFI